MRCLSLIAVLRTLRLLSRHWSRLGRGQSRAAIRKATRRRNTAPSGGKRHVRSREFCLFATKGGGWERGGAGSCVLCIKKQSGVAYIEPIRRGEAVVLIRKSLISAHFTSLHLQPTVSDLFLLPILARRDSRDSFCISLHNAMLKEHSAVDADLNQAERSTCCLA